MDDYLSKPIKAEDLFRTLERLVPATDPGREPYESLPAALAGVSIDGASLLARADGDVDLLRELARLFIEHGPRMLDELREALMTLDARAVERSAHRIKGSLDTVAATVAADLAHRLECLGREGNLARAGELFLQLEREFRHMSPELTALAQKADV